MKHPYKEAAWPAPEPERAVFRYVESQASFCPCCGRRGHDPAYNREGQLCHPFVRVRVRGHLWWKRSCPLSGRHRHYKCTCGAHYVENLGPVAVKEADLD